MSITLTVHDTVQAAFAENNNLIVFATDDTYTSYCGVAIASLGANASPSKNYDIVILEDALSDENKNILTDLVQNAHNISVRFFNVKDLLVEYKDLLYISGHVSLATYYRFFITKIFPLYDKALYLDCDIIIDGDVAVFTDIDFKGNLVAATQDLVLMLKNTYLTKHLKLQKGAKYFNAGSILFNLTELAKRPFLEDCFQILREHRHLRWHDQDTFNILFQGKTLFVSPKWNYITDLNAYGNSLEAGLPKEEYQAFLRVEQDPDEAPCIIHYAGTKKPWKGMQAFLSERFWHYAKYTPFYDTLLKKTLSLVPEALASARKKYRIYALASMFSWGNLRKKYKARKAYYHNAIISTEQFLKEHSAMISHK